MFESAKDMMSEQVVFSTSDLTLNKTVNDRHLKHQQTHSVACDAAREIASVAGDHSCCGQNRKKLQLENGRGLRLNIHLILLQNKVPQVKISLLKQRKQYRRPLRLHCSHLALGLKDPESNYKTAHLPFPHTSEWPPQTQAAR